MANGFLKAALSLLIAQGPNNTATNNAQDTSVSTATESQSPLEDYLQYKSQLEQELRDCRADMPSNQLVATMFTQDFSLESAAEMLCLSNQYQTGNIKLEFSELTTELESLGPPYAPSLIQRAMVAKVIEEQKNLIGMIPDSILSSLHYSGVRVNYNSGPFSSLCDSFSAVACYESETKRIGLMPHKIHEGQNAIGHEIGHAVDNMYSAQISDETIWVSEQGEFQPVFDACQDDFAKEIAVYPKDERKGEVFARSFERYFGEPFSCCETLFY